MTILCFVFVCILTIGDRVLISDVVQCVPRECSLGADHFVRDWFSQMHVVPPSQSAGAVPSNDGWFLVESSDHKVFRLRYEVFERASPVLAAHYKGSWWWCWGIKSYALCR